MAKKTLIKRGVATKQGIETIAQRVVRMRKEKGITQVEMAQLLGVSQSVVSDYERGALRLHGELIATVAEIFNVSADEILGLEAKAPQGARRSVRGAVTNRRLLRRVQQLDSLPKRDQEALLRTIDAFLAKSAA